MLRASCVRAYIKRVLDSNLVVIVATRAYEANVTAMNNAKAMAMKALEIGR